MSANYYPIFYFEPESSSTVNPVRVDDELEDDYELFLYDECESSNMYFRDDSEDSSTENEEYALNTYLSDDSEDSRTEIEKYALNTNLSDDSEDSSTETEKYAISNERETQNSFATDIKCSKNTETDTDSAAIKNFDFLFFISLRDTFQEVSIEEMIIKQIFFHKPKLAACFNRVIDRIPEKCLVILDGLDEWTPPKPLPTHPTVTRGLPLSSVYGKYSKLLTTRRWKYESLNPNIKEGDSEIRITGLGKKSSEKLIENMLVERDQVLEFKMAVGMSNTNDLLSTPLLLKLLICLWQTNSKLERSKTDLYCSIINIMLHLAEKREKRDEVKLPFENSATNLPLMLRKFRYIVENSKLVGTLSKFAFKSLFQEPYGSSVVFSAFDLSQQGLSSIETLLCLQTGILTQKSISNQSFLIPKASLSLIHKSFQEYFAAVYVSIAEEEKYKETKKLFSCRCCKTSNILEMANVLFFVADLSQDIFQDILKSIAKYYGGITLDPEMNLTMQLSEKDCVLTNIFLRCKPQSVVIKSTNFGKEGIRFSGQNYQLRLVELSYVRLTYSAFKTLLESIPVSEKAVDVNLVCISLIDNQLTERIKLSVHVQNVSRLKLKYTNLTKVEFMLSENIRFVELAEINMTDSGLNTLIKSVSATKSEVEIIIQNVILKKSQDISDTSKCRLLNIVFSPSKDNENVKLGTIKICKFYMLNDNNRIPSSELSIEHVDFTKVSFSSKEFEYIDSVNAISIDLGRFKMSNQHHQLQTIELKDVGLTQTGFKTLLENVPTSRNGVNVTLVRIAWLYIGTVCIRNVRELKIESTNLTGLKIRCQSIYC
ncbi:uncharacterized protein LOC132742571 [Ruditapes philippinarum]|uniref:uncharacterized protein LOC132742571 n=1 Tax=Ruditapes philippinarum TaxID=129788 RepID=UPI00295AFD54|nr:uncharacterized protein LOC132742571 [Ruditapes philippinarum]